MHTGNAFSSSPSSIYTFAVLSTTSRLSGCCFNASSKWSNAPFPSILSMQFWALCKRVETSATKDFPLLDLSLRFLLEGMSTIYNGINSIGKTRTESREFHAPCLKVFFYFYYFSQESWWPKKERGRGRRKRKKESIIVSRLPCVRIVPLDIPQSDQEAEGTTEKHGRDRVWELLGFWARKVAEENKPEEIKTPDSTVEQ